MMVKPKIVYNNPTSYRHPHCRLCHFLVGDLICVNPSNKVRCEKCKHTCVPEDIYTTMTVQLQICRNKRLNDETRDIRLTNHRCGTGYPLYTVEELTYENRDDDDPDFYEKVTPCSECGGDSTFFVQGPCYRLQLDYERNIIHEVFCSNRCRENYEIGKALFTPSRDANEVLKAYLGGGAQPRRNEERPVITTEQSKFFSEEKYQDGDNNITDVEKEEDVRCMGCLRFIEGQDALQCQECHHWVCNDCIEIDGDDIDETKFRCFMCEQSSSPEPDPEPKKPRLIHAAMTTIQEQVNTNNITEPGEHIKEQPGVLCCTCADIVNITFTDSCSRCPDYMCWDCITYYRCNEYGLVKGKFVCSCCAGLDDEETSQSTSTMSSLESSDSEDDESQLLQHWKNWQQSNMTSHTLGTCPINTGSQDSHSAYLYGSVQDQPEFKEKEDKFKMKNYKRKRKGRSNKKRRSTRTTGKKTRNQDKSGSLREQLPEGDVSQREHAPGFLAEQLPGSPNIPQETGNKPLDLRWLVDSQVRDMTEEEHGPKIIVLEIFMVSKNDNRHSCDKPICTRFT